MPIQRVYVKNCQFPRGGSVRVEEWCVETRLLTNYEYACSLSFSVFTDLLAR